MAHFESSVEPTSLKIQLQTVVESTVDSNVDLLQNFKREYIEMNGHSNVTSAASVSDERIT